MRKIVFIIVVVAVVAVLSCNPPSRRLQTLVRNHPELLSHDAVHDTVKTYRDTSLTIYITINIRTKRK